MLTQTDLNAIGRLIDKKVSTDISAIQTRLADLETGRITKFDFIVLRNLIGSVEKRMAALEDKMSKTVTKEESKKFATKDDLKKFSTKKDLRAMENRIIESINIATDHFDEKVIDYERRIKNLENSHSVSIA